jgi:hypothetical protein
MKVESAAWVPDDDPERPWDEAADLAVGWLLQEARRRGQQPLLVTPTQQQWSSGADAIRRMAQQYDATTPRSRGSHGGNRPVLAYVPYYDEMHLALNNARGSAIAVVETVSCPLIGWAVEAGAINLLTGEATPDPRSENQLKEFDRIYFYGNNGWGDSFVKQAVSRILADLRDAGEMDRDLLLGYVVARGKHGDAVKRLGALVDRVMSGRR